MSRMPYLLLCLLLSLSSASFSQTIRIAAASDLTEPLKEIARSFEVSTGDKSDLIFGSSGNLAAQIENGAPFDLFLSADSEQPRKLIEGGKAFGRPVEYASGKIVLWVRSDSPFAKKLSVDALRSPEINRIAIANPQHAPYGRAAAAAFANLGLTQAVQPKLVLGENIAQTAQFVLSGNADAGVIALSVALSAPMKDRGVYVLFPPESYPKITQAAVLTSAGKNNRAAQRFLRYLLTSESQAVLKQYGFDVPKAQAESSPH